MIHAFALLLAFAAAHLIVPLTGERARPIRAETVFHTLFSDFHDERDGTTFVETGDIPAMWIRDSSAQAMPYVRFAQAYPILATRLAGVIERNAQNIDADPYANGFDERHRVWERKWEAGSPAWPVFLAWTYWKTTGYRAMFTPQLHKALRKIVDTWRCEQLHGTCSRYTLVDRRYTYDEYNPHTGMIWTAFRPSDDPVTYHFNVPQEIVVTLALQEIGSLAMDGYGDRDLSNEALSIAADVATGVMRYGRVWNAAYGGWIYVYETDGLGHDVYMDDANLPNLTSLPDLGWCSPFDPTYLNTRAYALSKRNPWYFSGSYASGLGSPHTPWGFVWPLGIMARALTATSSQEVAASITTLAETDSEQGLIHESFDPNAYWVYTRAYFGWGNALYAELLMRSVAGFPAVPFSAYTGTAVGYEPLGKTPALTPLLTQVEDATILYGTLADLLEEAGGRAIIPRIRSAMEQQEGKHTAMQWRQLEDSHDPIVLKNGVPMK